MEKKYKVEANSITGVKGNIFYKGDTVPHSFLLNQDEHLAQGHITEATEEAAAAAETTPAAPLNNGDGTTPVKKK